MVKRTTRSSTSPGLSTRRRHGVSMGLMMECQDDDLSPSQIDYMRKCRLEYDKAMAMIKEAQTKARLGKATVSIQKNAGKVPQVMPISSSNAATPKQQNTQKEMPNRSTSPDVIIVGETPATPKSTVPVAAAKTRVPVPVARPPAGLTPQQIVVRPLQNTQPARLPQTVLKVIPVTSQPLQFGYPQPQTLVSQQQATVRPTYNQRFIASQNSASSMLLNSALQAKRNLDNMQDSDGPLRKKQKKVDTNEVGNWVPLDEYYYGKMEGDPSYVEEKGEFRFKCWYCSKMLYNNVKAMMHIQGHIDSGKQHNLDLSDLTQCKHCYKQFDTPFEMQTHVEKVHMNGANVLLCRICERDHESRNALTHHMRQNHTACEMPYICQLCSFRSSMYSDVVDHFKKKHDSSQHILCLYCLKIFKVKFVTQGWGQTQTYYGHLLKHQSKTATRKCTLCRLTFFNTGEVKSHKKKDHTANHKGILGTNNRYTTPGQVMIKVPESGLHGKQQSLKSLNAPTVSKILDFGGTRFPTVVNYLTCLECKMSMGTPDHFKKHIECSMCRFATSCSIAYANHMMGFHSGQMSSLNLNIPWERRMESPMYCLCGFSSRYGNRIANHLVYCTKRTCYRSKQHTPGEEGTSDEEVGDPRRKPGASLLDVLGLVKKRTIATKIRRGSKEEDRSIPPFRVNPGKVRSEASGETEDSTVALPKEETSPVSTGAPDVDNTPPELKGSRKWKTVKIKDQEIPSKASVFLGQAKKEPKNEDDDEMENEETEDLCTEKDDSREVNPDIVKSSNVSPNNEEETMELDHNTSKSSVNDKDKDLKITAVFDDDDDNDDVKSLGKEEIDELLKETSDTSDMVVDDAVDKEKTDVDKEEKVDVSSRAEDVTNTSESTGNAGNETIENTADDKEKEDEQLPLVTEAVSDEVEQSAMSKTSDTVQEQSTECQPESEKEETEDEKISEVVAMETNTQDSEEDSGERGMHESSVTVDNHVQDKSKEEISAELEKSEECSSQTQEESTAEIPESLEKSEESTSQMQEKITEIVSEASEKSESSSSLMQEKSTEDISEASEKSESSSSLMQEKSTEDISEELEKSEESSHVQEKCMDEVSEVLEKSEESSSQIEEKSEESSSQMEEKSEEPTTEPPAQKTEKETEEQLEKISDKKRSDEMNERGDDINRELNKKSEVKSDDTKIQERTVVKENVKERSPDKGERSGERSSSTNRHNSEDRGPGSKSDSRGPRGDSRFDHHHGDRSHNYYEKRSHDSRYGSGSHRDDGRSHNRYQHEDRSYDYKRGQDYQRDKYHGGSYNDRRDNRGYQDNRNYHGNHPYGNRGRDDRRRDGHYDNYNRNQGQYNRGGRGGYGYRGGYQGSYR